VTWPASALTVCARHEFVGGSNDRRRHDIELLILVNTVRGGARLAC
jgi:hypothetical protein